MFYRDYLRKNGIKAKDAAEKLGISESYLYLILKGRFKPGRELSTRMVDLSNGCFTLDDICSGRCFGPDVKRNGFSVIDTSCKAMKCYIENKVEYDGYQKETVNQTTVVSLL